MDLQIKPPTDMAAAIHRADQQRPQDEPRDALSTLARGITLDRVETAAVVTSLERAANAETVVAGAEVPNPYARGKAAAFRMVRALLAGGVVPGACPPTWAEVMLGKALTHLWYLRMHGGSTMVVPPEVNGFLDGSKGLLTSNDAHAWTAVKMATALPWGLPRKTDPESSVLLRRWSTGKTAVDIQLGLWFSWRVFSPWDGSTVASGGGNPRASQVDAQREADAALLAFCGGVR